MTQDMKQDWPAIVGELDRLLKLRSIPFAMKLFERREAMEGMKALSRNGFRYPFPQYGVQQDVRAGMAVSYPGR